MARLDLLEELDAQVQDSIKWGQIIVRRQEGEQTRAFYLPTVLTDVKKGMPVYEQETFGPVSAIIPVKDADEAIAVANDSRFGLGGSLWSQDIKRAEMLARRVESGAFLLMA